DQNDALALGMRSIDRLTRLINELLDVSRIEAGKLELCCEDVDLTALVREIASNFEPLARERGLAIKTELPARPIDVFVDRDKMTQVFTNLIQNALKFTVTGSVEIGLETAPEGVRCRVSDTGPGIASQKLPELFSKFAQLGPVPNGRERGTGLGLSLCKGIVELHRGRIWAESALGKGTHVFFVVPRTAVEVIFKDEVEHLLHDAISSGRPLTLVRFCVDQWRFSSPSGKAETPDFILYRLQAVVKTALGVETVIVDK